MKNKIHHNKLIRDKIPGIIALSGAVFETRILSEKEFKQELRKKLVEEANEVLEENTNILDELADTLELIESIAEAEGYSLENIRKQQIKKRKERGGFKKKLFLEWTE